MLIKVTGRGQNKKYINIKMKQVREYSPPEHLTPNKNNLLQVALWLYLLFYASIPWLTCTTLKKISKDLKL
jgi:hypothetical protein